MMVSGHPMMASDNPSQMVDKTPPPTNGPPHVDVAVMPGPKDLASPWVKG